MFLNRSLVKCIPDRPMHAGVVVMALCRVASRDIKDLQGPERSVRPPFPRVGGCSAWPRNRLPKSPRRQACFPVSSTSFRSAAAAPLAAHIRPLFLPDLVQQIARNKQINANRREQAHPAFRKWAKDLKQGVLQQLHETQVEQDFNHVLLRRLGYTTQSDVASDQPWTD